MRSLGCVIATALTLGAAAQSATAQVDPARFQLVLYLAARTYSNETPGVSVDAADVFPGSPINVNSLSPNALARTVRLEVRYRVLVLGSTTGSYVGADGITYSSAGLSYVTPGLTSSRSLNNGDLRGAQTTDGSPVTNPTTLDLTDGTTGLYPPFRTGVFPDQPPGTDLGGSNGTFSPTGVAAIVPLMTASPGHLSSVNNNARLWGVYAVDLVVPFDAPAGHIIIALTPPLNNSWSFYPRAGTTTANNPIPVVGNMSISAAVDINVVRSGTCCNASGACTFVPQDQCTAVWSAGGACLPNPCPQPGPCCLATGVCSLLVQTACTGQWTQQGACLPNPCAQPGRCCQPSGVCTLVFQAACPAVWSQGGVCEPNSCPQPGRCCEPSGACSFVLQSACSQQWTQGGTCAPNSCPQPGSCCVPDRSCTIGLQSACAFLWRQNGTCTPNTCPAPCRADFNQSVSLTVADIFAFLPAWFGNDLRTDFNGSGVVDVPDIFLFLTEWFAGCP